jgi:hypothetical protein
MNIKNLQQGQLIYNQIVALDKEIIGIEKKAMILANQSQVVTLQLAFESNSESNKPVSNPNDDPYGLESITTRWLGILQESRPPSFLFSMGSPKSNKADTIDLKLSETEALMVLGVILSIKKDQRNSLLNQLRELGFKD